MPYLVNRHSPVTAGSILYSWVVMVVPLRYEGSGIPLLKCFMVAPFIIIYVLPLSKYLPFTSLVNASWLNIVDVIVATPIPPVLGCLVVYF